MVSRDIVLDAVVIRGHDYGEADRIITLFSEQQGKVSVFARGVRKPTSKNRAACQLFSQGKFALKLGRGLPNLSQAQSENSFAGLWQDLDKIAYASYFAELIDRTLPEGRSYQDIYILLLTVLTILELSDEPETVARLFELRFLAYLGYTPHLESCIACNRGLSGGQFILVPERGGVLCQSCQNIYQEVLLSVGSIRNMQQLLKMDLRKIFNLKINLQSKQEIDAALENYLKYYLENGSKARKMLKELLDKP